MKPERSSPLLERHRQLGAKLTEFGGWQMPLQYSGVIAEHNAVRTDAGVFDVSHLGKLRVTGEAGGRALQHALTADVLALPEGRATYSIVLTEQGGCIDDVFVYRLDAVQWLVVPNASNVSSVAEAVSNSGGEPADEWDRWAILAIQGPRSFELFEEVFPGTDAVALELHAWSSIDVFGERGLVARTGYTGERGFELYAPAPTAVQAFDALLERGGVPVGLGARDTLRLEMGYALYGHEISRDIDPLTAGLGWAIAWDTDFRGKQALLALRERGTERRLTGIVCTERGVPRQGYAVSLEGRGVGEVTSGNYSPTLETGIALALVRRDASVAEGDRVEIVGRGRSIQGDIVKPPFVRSGRQK